ncbi:ribosomal protein S5 domain 2-type protein [Mycena sp. CBHHK59/15]|nr:ribosomal protein S5 domain 2-type protein [Mycena sp. CBHHK59/15]
MVNLCAAGDETEFDQPSSLTCPPCPTHRTTPAPRALAHPPRLNAKRATHCMYAYRAAGVAGQSDGGEGGSGDRLARLLALTACDNVVVVVWRWYGGVKLGADRWKRISEVGKEALDLGGFLSKKDEGQYKSKGKKKK